MRRRLGARFLRTAMVAGLCFAVGGNGMARTALDRCTEDAILVFDGSGSMAEMGYNGLDLPRIMEAREALRESLPEITPFRRVGLVVYGPGRDEPCLNVKLRLPPTPDAAGLIISEVDQLDPGGQTPLTRAVEDAAHALSFRDRPGTIVLITDGKENCGGATCQLAAQLAADGLDLTVHVIGFKVRDRQFNWQSQKGVDQQHGKTIARCLADRTGGKYVSTESIGELVQALQETLACPMVGQSAPPEPPVAIRSTV
ncbi:MAG: VWA domain-containing protein [Ahrensia sp.]|nr:VWA domain-containing protein [Ahrensia sp.]